MARTTTFSLRNLLLAFVVIASALGTFGPWGLLLGVSIVVVVGSLQMHSVSGCSFLAVAAMAIPFLGAVAILVFAILEPPLRHRLRTSMNNLKQLSLALKSYEEHFGTLPPAYVPGPDGKPWHSWRVLILPWLERQDLYKAYDFNEPWNGPNNSKLEVYLRIYVNPVSRSNGQHKPTTSYFAVVGPKTAWPGTEPRRTDDIPDGAANTILLVETGATDISWMEPRDLDYDQLVREGFRAGGDRTSPHPYPYKPGFPYVCEGGEVIVAMADGSVDSFDWELPGDALRPLLTVDGGEEVDLDALAPVRSPWRFNWPLILSFATLVVSSLLLWLLSRPRRATE